MIEKIDSETRLRLRANKIFTTRPPSPTPSESDKDPELYYLILHTCFCPLTILSTNTTSVATINLISTDILTLTRKSRILFDSYGYEFLPSMETVFITYFHFHLKL
jgi:hypothetical protein